MVKLEENLRALSEILDPIREHVRLNLRQIAQRLKQNDGESWAVGEMLERACIYLDAVSMGDAQVKEGVSGSQTHPASNGKEYKLLSIEQAQEQVSVSKRTRWFKDAVPSGITCPDCGAELLVQVMAITDIHNYEREARCPSCVWSGSIPLLKCAMDAHKCVHKRR